MRVISLNRHPVKSLQAESPPGIELDDLGVVGDRAYGIVDAETGRVLSAKWEPRLLEGYASTADRGVVLGLPTGTVSGPGAEADALLSAWLGRPVRLARAGRHDRGTFQTHVDPLDDSSEAVEWTGPAGGFRDSSPVHLLTTGSLRAMARIAPLAQWDARRFRANVVVDVPGDRFVEDDWVGSRLCVGEVVLEVTKRTSRCSMIGRAQPEGVAADREVIRSLRDAHGLDLGVHARVVAPGRIDVGARVERVEA